MKNLFYNCLFLLIISGFITSCTNEDETINETNSLSLYKDVDELIQFSRIHSEGLIHNLKAFENEIKSKDLNKTLTENEIKTFFEEQTISFLEQNQIIYNKFRVEFVSNDIIEFNKKINLEKDMRLNVKANDETFIDIYFKKIEDSFGTNPYQIVLNNLNEVYQDFLTEELFIPEAEKASIEIMIGVAFDSANFWYNYYDMEDNSLKFNWDWGVALADVTGAATGGLWGSAVAGPLGGVVMAVNMAIIDSSVAHTINQIPAPF